MNLHILNIESMKPIKKIGGNLGGGPQPPPPPPIDATAHLAEQTHTPYNNLCAQAADMHITYYINSAL